MGLLRENKRYGATDVHVGYWEHGSDKMISRGVEYEVRVLMHHTFVTDYEWEGGARFAGSGVRHAAKVPVATVWKDGKYVGWISTNTSFIKETTVHFFQANDLSKRVSDRQGREAGPKDGTPKERDGEAGTPNPNK